MAESRQVSLPWQWGSPQAEPRSLTRVLGGQSAAPYGLSVGPGPRQIRGLSCLPAALSALRWPPLCPALGPLSAPAGPRGAAARPPLSPLVHLRWAGDTSACFSPRAVTLRVLQSPWCASL